MEAEASLATFSSTKGGKGKEGRKEGRVKDGGKEGRTGLVSIVGKTDDVNRISDNKSWHNYDIVKVVNIDKLFVKM